MRSTLEQRVLAELSPDIARLIKSHIQKYPVDAVALSDLIQEAAVRTFENPGKNAQQIFNSARGALRRLRYGVGSARSIDISDLADELFIDSEEEEDEGLDWRRASVVRRVAEQRGIKVRQAQVLVARALLRARDSQLFGGAL